MHRTEERSGRLECRQWDRECQKMRMGYRQESHHTEGPEGHIQKLGLYSKSKGESPKGFKNASDIIQ